ncbi:uncharacterized protein LOC101854440 [Aplysia californica]|uniref:Uncharacterized protein LOC101854440 n=1 Tax=Aplysia californica TaxID=6500 RepID=A0ABM0K3L9_APLCA|nr:uncharacterized protein LOC101854440 [Aplysia californica]
MAGTPRVTCWSISGAILIAFSTVFVIFASAFPYWQERELTREAGFPHVGLWEICFREDGEPAPPWANDALTKRYYGCNYVFDRELRTILHWIYPGWFIGVTFLVTLGLLLQPVAFIIDILFFVRVCSAHLEHVLVGVAFLLTTINGFTTAIAIIIFGIKSDTDQYWIPDPKSSHLSYSFAVCAFVPVLSWLAGMCHGVEFLRLKSIRDRNARAKVYARGEFGRY